VRKTVRRTRSPYRPDWDSAKPRNWRTCTRAPHSRASGSSRGAWRSAGINSKFLALQIKAIEQGLLPRLSLTFFPSPLDGRRWRGRSPRRMRGPLSAETTDPHSFDTNELRSLRATDSPTMGRGERKGGTHTCRPFSAPASIATAWWRTGRSTACGWSLTDVASVAVDSKDASDYVFNTAAPFRWCARPVRQFHQELGRRPVFNRAHGLHIDTEEQSLLHR